MAKLKTLTLAAMAVVLAGGVSAVEETTPQKPLLQSLQQIAVASDGEYRLSQTATCIYNGQRYSKGARICMNGVYNYCNSRGLWEPSNLTC